MPADTRSTSAVSGERSGNPWPPDPIGWPEFCCAILTDVEGKYLVERRSPRAASAPGQLACFGGKRDGPEHPDRCIRREIKEELGWSVGALRLVVAVRLRDRRSGREIAWFYKGRAPRANLTLTALPGSTILRLSATELLAAPDLSAWHRAVLEADSRGEDVCWIEPDNHPR